jgi:hypothetical protein
MTEAYVAAQGAARVALRDGYRLGLAEVRRIDHDRTRARKAVIIRVFRPTIHPGAPFARGCASSRQTLRSLLTWTTSEGGPSSAALPLVALGDGRTPASSRERGLALQRLLGRLDERLGLPDGDLALLAAHPAEAVLGLVL